MLDGSACGQGISGPLNCVPQGLAIDSKGRAHLIWDAREDDYSTQVYYAFWDGQRWTGVDASAEPGGVSYSGRAGSTRARLALDRRDRPHIVWINNEDYRSIEYRYWDGGKWREDRIPWYESETGELALAVDSHNRQPDAQVRVGRGHALEIGHAAGGLGREELHLPAPKLQGRLQIGGRGHAGGEGQSELLGRPDHAGVHRHHHRGFLCARRTLGRSRCTRWVTSPGPCPQPVRQQAFRAAGALVDRHVRRPYL
jgi:hypothetical protein